MTPLSIQIAVSVMLSGTSRGLAALAFVGCSLQSSGILLVVDRRSRTPPAFCPDSEESADKESGDFDDADEDGSKPSFSASSVKPWTRRISFPCVVDLFASR